jgi:hypothetical protein
LIQVQFHLTFNIPNEEMKGYAAPLSGSHILLGYNALKK